MKRKVTHLVEAGPARTDDGGPRIRPSLCGTHMCIAGYLDYADGYTHSATGKPLANGVSRRQYATCPACLEVSS